MRAIDRMAESIGHQQWRKSMEMLNLGPENSQKFE